MLSANAYSFRLQSRLAISLSWVAGFTNAVTLVATAHMTSHVTGSLTFFGLNLIDRRDRLALYFVFLIAAFLFGAVVSALATELGRRRGVRSHYILPIAIQALLLSLLAAGLAWWPVIADNNWPALCLVSGAASMAMGLQNATITRISGSVVRTTHLTGVVTDLGLEGVQFLFWWRDRTRGRLWQRRGRVLRISRRHPTLLRLFLLASIIGSFLLGVLVGVWTYERWHAPAMLLPVAFLVWIIVMDWRTPIADVRELDPLNDPDLALGGFVRDMLPAGLGIYRLSHHRAGVPHRAPNFQLWADRLPERWRVIILSLGAMTHLEGNAVLDLTAAAERLRAAGRQLVVASVTPAQYRALDEHGAVDALTSQNICPDLELAIARGINLLHEPSDG